MFWKEDQISIVGTFKNIYTVPVQCKKIFRGHFSGWLLSLEFKVYLEKFIPSSEM